MSSNARAARRMPSSSSTASSAEESDEVEDDEDEVLQRSRSAPSFRGFALTSTQDKYEPKSGLGPKLVVETRRLPAGLGVEHALTVDDDLKLCTVERTPLPDALPETLCTVSKRSAQPDAPPGHASRDFEIVYSRLATVADATEASGVFGDATRERMTSIDALAGAGAQASRPVERGDASVARSALEQAARLYGTSRPELVDAMRTVVPPEMGATLAVLCC